MEQRARGADTRGHARCHGCGRHGPGGRAPCARRAEPRSLSPLGQRARRGRTTDQTGDGSVFNRPKGLFRTSASSAGRRGFSPPDGVAARIGVAMIRAAIDEAARSAVVVGTRSGCRRCCRVIAWSHEVRAEGEGRGGNERTRTRFVSEIQTCHCGPEGRLTAEADALWPRAIGPGTYESCALRSGMPFSARRARIRLRRSTRRHVRSTIRADL